MDAGGFALSNGACNVWRQHLPLMEKFDYMMDMVTLHTKGYCEYDCVVALWSVHTGVAVQTRRR